VLVKKTSKNQFTLPRKIAGDFEGVDYFDASLEDNRIVLVPVRIVSRGDSLAKIREKATKLGVTEGDVAEAVRWARQGVR